MYQPRKCKICGDIFLPKSSRQYYCKKPIVLKCIVCGEYYEGVCHPDNPKTCSKPECKKKAGYVSQLQKLPKRTCVLCGYEFQPVTGNQQTCNRPIKKICVMCGNEFDDICALQHESKTCSDACKNKLLDINKKAYWGKLTRICKWCGKEFHPSSNTACYCEGPHYKKCKICGKEFQIDPADSDQRNRLTCSDECASINRGLQLNTPESHANQQRAMIAKYGVKSPTQVPEIRAKQLETTKQKYGVEYYTQLGEEYKKKAIATNREKYGADWFDWFNQIEEYQEIFT